MLSACFSFSQKLTNLPPIAEYMEYGSLYDLLSNETMHAGGEIILQICRDIAQGLRYLHASKPPILHGDLKAKNILIDSRFRAKVCDFGLSTKRKNGLSGTPYFMAPEYLRGRVSVSVFFPVTYNLSLYLLLCAQCSFFFARRSIILLVISTQPV